MVSIIISSLELCWSGNGGTVMDAGCLGLLEGQGVTGGDGPVVENNSFETIREQNTSLMHATHITAFMLQVVLSQAEQKL